MTSVPLFVLACAICAFHLIEPVSTCAPTTVLQMLPTTTTVRPQGANRRRRSIEEKLNTLQLLTNFKYEPKENDRNAEVIENQFLKLKESNEYDVSDLGKLNRKFSNNEGSLKISYDIALASKCFEDTFYETAFYKIAEVNEAYVVCQDGPIDEI